MLFSILIPTYNRKSTVCAAIQSALDFTAASGQAGEVIVIDDASTDGTPEIIHAAFAAQITLITLPHNQGVTRARMAGAAAAKGDWLIMLDSDDQLVPGAAVQAAQEMQSRAECPVLFFRCRSLQSGEMIGPPQSARPVTVRDGFLSNWPGECLTVFRADALRACPYEPRLRAFEGLTNARIMKRFGEGYMSDICMRIYDDSPRRKDRLSNFYQRFRRADEMSLGFSLLLSEFYNEMNCAGRIGCGIKFIAYFALSKLKKIISDS